MWRRAQKLQSIHRQSCSTHSRTANNQTAIHWEEPTTTEEPDTAGEDKQGQCKLWKAVLGQPLK